MDPVSQHTTTDHDNLEALLASFGVFCDFVELRLHFPYDSRYCVGASDAVEYDGIVSLSTEKSFDIDLKALALLVPDLRLCAEITLQPDGSVTADDLHTPFESIESHLGSMAVKIYPRGNTRLGLDPYVSVKLNPTKLTYGSNAFSDIRTLAQALPIALSAFVRACPELAALVDVAGAQVMRLDSTSGVQCATVADVGAMLDRVGHVQVGHVHAAGTMETYADAEQKIRQKCGTTVYFNATSEHQRGVCYPKGPEAREELKRLTAEARRDPGNAALAARVEALSDPAYQTYCEKLLRFEARTMRRGLIGQLERFGITDWNGTAVDLIRCERQLADVGKALTYSLWAHVWRPVLSALWGDPTMSLANETELEAKLSAYYEKNFTGRARSMGLRRALCHLRAIIDRGWVAAKNSPPASQASWYRTIAELVDAGISRAALQSCEGTAESRLAAGVVVSIRSVLEVQAINTAPSWFKSTDLSRWMDDMDLMQVPHRHRRAVGDGLVDCIGSDDGLCGPVDNRPHSDAEIRSFLGRSRPGLPRGRFPARGRLGSDRRPVGGRRPPRSRRTPPSAATSGVRGFYDTNFSNSYQKGLIQMNDKTTPSVGASGLYLVGEIAGVKQDSYRNGEHAIQRHTVGVRITTVDAYGGETAELVEIRLPQAAVDAGLPRQLEGLRGQILSLPVWVQPYTGKRGAGFALMLDSKQQILGL